MRLQHKIIALRKRVAATPDWHQTSALIPHKGIGHMLTVDKYAQPVATYPVSHDRHNPFDHRHTRRQIVAADNQCLQRGRQPHHHPVANCDGSACAPINPQWRTGRAIPDQHRCRLRYNDWQGDEEQRRASDSHQRTPLHLSPLPSLHHAFWNTRLRFASPGHGLGSSSGFLRLPLSLAYLIRSSSR